MRYRVFLLATAIGLAVTVLTSTIALADPCFPPMNPC